MTTIYKYKLDKRWENGVYGEEKISMPEWAKVQSAGLDAGGNLCVWALVSTNQEMKDKSIYVIGTGKEVPPNVRFINSVTIAPFVWHIFVKDS